VHLGRLWRVWLAMLVISGSAAACGSARPAGTRPPVSSRSIGSTAPPPKTTAPTSTPTTRRPTVPPSTSTSDPATTKPAKPPYPLASEVLPLVDASRPTVSHGILVARTRRLTTLVWLPSAPGRWPLVVFAHGFQVGPAPYAELLEAWAAQGFVVAAPEFPLSDQAVAGANLDENDLNQQPADVRFVADALVAPGAPLAGRIDASRVGVAGHSDGAEAALAVSLSPAPAGQPVIRAVIAMSVQPLPGVTATANPPILVTQGDADTINPLDYGQQTWAEAAGPKYLAILHGAGHLPPLEAGSSWLPSLEATTEAFLRTYVAGDAPSSSIVAAGSNPPLVTITAAG
jgi:acetyl esterase/lipase